MFCFYVHRNIYQVNLNQLLQFICLFELDGFCSYPQRYMYNSVKLRQHLVQQMTMAVSARSETEYIMSNVLATIVSFSLQHGQMMLNIF